VTILNSIAITNVLVTPVAFHDPPLLNAVGVHEPFALRSIIEVETDAGITGIGESYGDIDHLARLRRVGEALRGVDVFATHQILATTQRALGGVVGSDSHGLTGSISANGTVLRTFSAVEVAALDIQGKALGPSRVGSARGRGARPSALLGLPLLQMGGSPRARSPTVSATLSPPPTSWRRRAGCSTRTVFARSS
jgi:hypothetical protein